MNQHRNLPGAFAGLESMAGGIGFVLSTPSVWPYALAPITSMAVLTCGLSVAAFWGAAQAAQTWLGEPTTTWGHVGSWALTILLGLVGLFLSVLLGFVLAQPTSGWALEVIARAQERALTGTTPAGPAGFASVFQGLKVTLVTLLIGCTVFPALLAVNLFFPPAVIVTLPLNFLLGGWLLAWDFFDYPLSIQNLGVRARLHWVRRHLSAFTVFGIAWSMLLLVPGMVLLILPMGVAGATQLHVKSVGKSVKREG